MTGPLTAGEWESLIYVVPDRVRHLVLKLAVHHGAVQKSEPKDCPVCGKRTEEPQQEVVTFAEK